MDQQQIIESLATRAKAVGLPMYEVCKKAGMAASTPSRWRRGHNGMTVTALQKLTAVIEAAEREAPAA